MLSGSIICVGWKSLFSAILPFRSFFLVEDWTFGLVCCFCKVEFERRDLDFKFSINCLMDYIKTRLS